MFEPASFHRSATAALGAIGCALTAAALLGPGPALAQSPPDPDYVRQEIFPSYQDFKNELLSIVNDPDPVQREMDLDAFWQTLQDAGQVPYAQGNQYAFLYRGTAGSVAWRGDFNGWGQSAGTNFAGTDLWIREGALPDDARSDYKLYLNGSLWTLDPANPLQMWSGFGPNSELRMPDYAYPHETVRQPGVLQGALTNNITTVSSNLGYSVNHRVYTPAGYDANNLADLPVVYVTDGHEYLADHMGSVVVTLDNLIHDGTLQPTVAVFIDPREPGNPGNNRRASEYTGNASFAGFVADELVPIIDAAYRTDDTASGRTILGTSLGGVNSAYFGGTRSDVFENLAVQSPSNFPSIFDLFATQALQDAVDIYITHGSLNDGSGGSNFASLLNTHGYDYTYLQTNEGHSWGNWRALIDNMLIDLIGPATLLLGDANNDGQVTGADLIAVQQNFGNVGSPNGLLLGDANDDGQVTGADLISVQQNFGNALAPAPGSMPEPATATLLALGALTALRPRADSLKSQTPSG